MHMSDFSMNAQSAWFKLEKECVACFRGWPPPQSSKLCGNIRLVMKQWSLDGHDVDDVNATRFERRKEGNRLRDFRRLNHGFSTKPARLLWNWLLTVIKFRPEWRSRISFVPRIAHKSCMLVIAVCFPRYEWHAMTFNLWHLATMRQMWGEKKIGCDFSSECSSAWISQEADAAFSSENFRKDCDFRVLSLMISFT